MTAGLPVKRAQQIPSSTLQIPSSTPPNPKLQAPNPKEAPSSKSQGISTSNRQTTAAARQFGLWKLGFRWDLDIGASLGFGTWSLGLTPLSGISHPRRHPIDGHEKSPPELNQSRIVRASGRSSVL